MHDLARNWVYKRSTFADQLDINVLCLVLALRGAGRLPPLDRGCGIMPRSLLTSAKDILGQGRDYTQLVKQVKDILPQFSDFFRQLVNCVFNGMYFIQFVLVQVSKWFNLKWNGLTWLDWLIEIVIVTATDYSYYIVGTVVAHTRSIDCCFSFSSLCCLFFLFLFGRFFRFSYFFIF